jgi:3-hydroxyphenylacetate 6-hydroxylase
MSMLGLSYLLIMLIVASLAIAPFLYEKRRRGLRIPNVPGPMGLPIFGNIYDIRKNAAEQYRKWSHQYGDVFQIQLGDIPVLVVNSASAAKAIFLGHSNALSSRPVFFTFHKVRLPFNNMTVINVFPDHRQSRRSNDGYSSNDQVTQSQQERHTTWEAGRADLCEIP